MSFVFPTLDGPKINIVIPVMGPTGSGKSKFINTLLGQERMKVGRGLTSCTGELEAAVLEPAYEDPILKEFRITIVDTPGFDDTYKQDAEILNKIADWLEKSYKGRAKLGGVIYLHDLSDDRFSGTARRSFDIFQPLCGQEAFSGVVLGITKWKRIEASLAEQREAELKEVHWKSLREKGSVARRFEDSRQSAQSFIYDVVRNYRQRLPGEIILQIQNELVNEHKLVHETEAGRRIVFDLKELLEIQRRIADTERKKLAGGDKEAEAALEEAEEKIRRLVRQIKDSKPLLRRVWGNVREFLDRLNLTEH